MAGIGFELRKILRRDTLTSTLAAYGYAGVISAGPLILSILGILLIGMMSLAVVQPPGLIVQFQVSSTSTANRSPPFRPSLGSLTSHEVGAASPK